MTKFPMTVEGAEALRAELDKLKKKNRQCRKQLPKRVNTAT